MKKNLQLIFLTLSIIIGGQATIHAHTPTPQWKWAKGVGGNASDYPMGYNTSSYFGSMRVDTAGNVYEVITGNSSSYMFGTYNLSTPGGFLVKYGPMGNVLWAKTFPRVPTTQGGGTNFPLSMVTTDAGTSYLVFNFADSFRLGSFFITDTIWRHNGTSGRTPYCIAQYDPNGNVVALHAHQAKRSSILALYKFYDNKILALGINSNDPVDTLDGYPIVKGNFFAVMDSLGYILRAKCMGYDTASTLIDPSYVAVSNKSIYIQPYLSRPHISQSAMPIGNLSPYLNGAPISLLIKFDSTLNFQWFKTMGNALGSHIIADAHDNVYLTGIYQSNPNPDTLIYDTTHLAMPYLPPFGVFQYHVLVKIDSSGALQWINKLVDAGTGQTTALCTDYLGNVYLAGKYSAFLLVGRDTLNDPSNLFVVKISKNGSALWGQKTENGSASVLSGIGEDGHGNLFLNGIFSYPNVHPFFGRDSLVCHTPVSGGPGAPDVFTARLGSCSPTTPALTAASPLHWCGSDSVRLTAPAGYSYLWSTGDTGRSIVASSSGLYSVYTVDTLGCYARSAIDTVTAHTQPVLHATVTQDVKCKNGTDGHISLQTTLNNGSVVYIYTPTIIDTLHVPAGHYSITATDMAHCTTHDSVVVSEPVTALQVHTDSLPTSNAGTGTAIVTASGGTAGYTYLWSNTQSTDTIRHLSSGWYRVTVTDHNGCQKSDSIYIRLILGIEGISEAHITLYPNPSNGTFYINTPIDAEMTIYDYTGRLVLEQRIVRGQNKITTEGLPAGTYAVEIKTRDSIYNTKISVSQ